MALASAEKYLAMVWSTMGGCADFIRDTGDGGICPSVWDFFCWQPSTQLQGAGFGAVALRVAVALGFAGRSRGTAGAQMHVPGDAGKRQSHASLPGAHPSGVPGCL